MTGGLLEGGLLGQVQFAKDWGFFRLNTVSLLWTKVGYAGFGGAE